MITETNFSVTQFLSLFSHFFFLQIIAIQEVRNTTKTLGKQRLWDSTRRFLEQGPLKYEMDLYNFIKQLFHRKLLAFGINPDDPFGAPVATVTLKNRKK